MSQALAQAHLFAPMMGQMTGQQQPAASAPPAQVQTTAPNSMSGQDFLQGLNSGSMAVDGSANLPPPAPTPPPAQTATSQPPMDEQTLARALYTGTPQNPSEMIANLLKSQGLSQEKAYQTGQLGVAQGGLKVEQARQASQEKYQTSSLALEKAKNDLDVALKNRQIDAETANNIRTNIAVQQARLDTLNEQTKGIMHPGVSANALTMMNDIQNQIQSLSSQLPSNPAGHIAVGGTIPGIPGKIKSIKPRSK
jgi:hypothetical protein